MGPEVVKLAHNGYRDVLHVLLIIVVDLVVPVNILLPEPVVLPVDLLVILVHHLQHVHLV